MKRLLIAFAPLPLLSAAAYAQTAEQLSPADIDEPAPPAFAPVTISGALSDDDADDRVAQIHALDDSGPLLNAVIIYDPNAAIKAQEAYSAGLALGGRTVLVKDNIETREWPTTAGSYALANNFTKRDAPIIARLRAAGGVVFGKTNLSEWANIRSTQSTSGWSAIGGLTRNPHATDRSACGSSSGSAAAVAAGMAWAAIGTETDGSITCPASTNGIVGFKPTLGLVSRTHIVPISSSQDTAGPMARNVTDAAALLTAIAGSDPADAATAEADLHTMDFTEGLANASLSGVKIGVLRDAVGSNAAVTELFEMALFDLQVGGAQLVDIAYKSDGEMGQSEFAVLQYELREGLDHYLSTSPADIPVRSLDDVIVFNRDQKDVELRWFDQDIFEAAAKATDSLAHERARAISLRLAGVEGIDRLLTENGVDFLIAPTVGPAWSIDLIYGDNFTGSIGAGDLAAIAGYPHLTLPMGAADGLPVGLSIIGRKWSDHDVLKAGAAYELVRGAQLPRPLYKAWEPSR